MSASALSRFLFLLETQGLVHTLFFGMLDLQTLTSVARVSPFFEASAIEMLYRRIDGPWPLLRLMPIDAADQMSNGFELQEIFPEHWIRFARIAGRVKYFDWSEDDSTICTKCLAVACGQLRDLMPTTSTSLLPNLHSFRSHCISRHGLQTCLPWLSPSLEHLAVSVDAGLDEEDILSFLNRAFSECRDIGSFALEMDKVLSPLESLEMSRGLAGGMVVMQKLVTLSLPLDLLSDYILDDLSKSGRLRHLILSKSASTLPTPSLKPQYSFPSLHHLSLRSFMGDVTAVVKTVGGCLQTICVHAPSLQDASEMRLALRAIVDYCPLFRELAIHFEDVNMQETASWLDLDPLLGHSLERLVIRHPCPLPISDFLLVSMIHSWPNARYVSLNPRPPLGPWTPGWDILPTWDCLITVAEAWHNLQHFGIYLKGDGGYIPLGNISPTSEVLSELDLGGTDIDLTQNLHSDTFIRRLFPNAKTILDSSP